MNLSFALDFGFEKNLSVKAYACMKLKGVLAELRGFIRAVENEEWYVTVKDRETRVDRAIYRPAYETALATLPKVKDEELICEAERVLERANEAVEKAIG